MNAYELNGKQPSIAESAWVADDASIVGDVTIGDDCSIWFKTVIRGDVNRVTIGARTNIQDLSCLHVTHRKHDLSIGDGVTVGHMCMLHGCRIEDYVLVGMRSLVLDGAVLGEKCFIGAGSLVTQGTVIPPRVLAFGSPARVVRDLTDDELQFLETSAANYVKYSGWYKESAVRLS